jgi:hypothetical protein
MLRDFSEDSGGRSTSVGDCREALSPRGADGSIVRLTSNRGPTTKWSQRAVGAGRARLIAKR